MPQAKERKWPPDAGTGGQFPSEPAEGVQLSDTHVRISDLQRLGIEGVCYLKSQSLWYFVTTAKSHTDAKFKDRQKVSEGSDYGRSVGACPGLMLKSSRK